MKDLKETISHLGFCIYFGLFLILSIPMRVFAFILFSLPEDLLKTEQNGEGLSCIIKEHKFTIMIIILLILIRIYRYHNHVPVLFIPLLIFSIFSLFELINSRFTILKYIGIGIFIISGMLWVLNTGPAMGPFNSW